MRSSISSLGVPDVSTAYRAAIQQFNSFGRNRNIPKILLVFSSGDDMYVELFYLITYNLFLDFLILLRRIQSNLLVFFSS